MLLFTKQRGTSGKIHSVAFCSRKNVNFVNFVVFAGPSRKIVNFVNLVVFARSSREIVNFVNFVAEFNPGHKCETIFFTAKVEV